jgi:hypothetical protein
MIKHWIVAIALATAGLACGTLKSKKEFLHDDLPGMEKAPFTVTGVPFEETRKRMIQFAGQCLGMVATDTMSNGTPGTGGAQFTTTYTPTIDQEGKKTSLYLAFDQRGSFGTGGALYVYLGQIWKGTAPNTTEGISYFRKSTFGFDSSDVSTRMIAWLKNEKKLCPSLQH